MRIRHVMAGVAAGGLLLSACEWSDFAGTEFSDRETLTRSVNEVRFANDSGTVRIVVGDTFEVKRTVGYGETRPGMTYRVDGDTLLLQDCQERDCWVSYDVTVPEGVTVSGHVDSGTVEVVGVASTNVQAESGEVVVRDVAGEVNATAQSGSVELSGIGGPVVAATESGSVTITMAAPRNVTARAESGHIELTVPKGSYQVHADSESGVVLNDIGGSSGPVVELSTDSGNVTTRFA